MAERRSETLRLFVACELPDDVRRALGNVQADLTRSGAEGLRWVRPEGIHITLKFLGAVEDSRVPKLRSALAQAVDPFELRLQPATLGGFGGPRLRVVWIGLEGDTEGLAALAARVEKALVPLGFPRERRPFAPHLTLARVPDPVPADQRQSVVALLDQYALPPLPSMVLNDVRLIRSVLSPSGSTYHLVARFPDGPSGPEA
ncbi:MAG: RNA 2',3'-cyclic phosphodiesterase [Dehalococcoidia bacterium]|nr:RNA 2',3'-cyclic phosphodiesterase [Dehalococcoidia bacterium]